MKTIVCYGDSNTFGYDPYTLGRYDYDVRWTGRLQSILGRDDYYVIEEGLGDRTTVLDDPLMLDNKNGHAMLPAIIASHMPIDLLIIMLGSNDLKPRYCMEAPDIARGVSKLVTTAKTISALENPEGKPCEILVIAPALMTEALRDGDCWKEFGEHSLRVSKELSGWYREYAEAQQVYFMDAAEIVQPSNKDGIHFSPEGHAVFAKKIAEKVKEILG